MCGRFPASKSGDELQREFNLRVIRKAPAASYNIAPTEDAPVVINDGERALDVFRWGLIPWWAKDARMGGGNINARAESLAEKPAFRDAFKLRRCIVLADGFFEWKAKVPHLIRLNSGGSMAFAGLWESWKAPEGNRVLTCTIVTTAPNDFMARIHNRMPVILAPELLDDWLEPHPVDPADLQPLLKACPSDWLEAFPVSTLVNKADSDGPDCVKPVELKPDAQGSLF